MRPVIRTLINEVEDLISRVGTNPVWGYGHCVRVYELATQVAREEDVDYDPEILRLASLLHDIGLYRAYNLREAPNHAERSAAVAERILRDGDFPRHATRVVVEAIRRHQPGSDPALSAESRLLNDAVSLDYLGSIGVSRVIAMVGLEEDVPDLATAFSHAEGLRRSIPNLLLYDASRDLAAERVMEMDDFLAAVRRSTKDLKLI